MKERMLPRWLYGVIALAVSVCASLLLLALSRSSFSRETNAWVVAVWYTVAIPIALRGFPSWTSIMILFFLALFLYHWPDTVISPQFQTVGWLVLTAGSIMLLRRAAGVSAVLLLIGSVGGVVMSALYAFGRFTLDYMVLDGPAWAHWSFEALADAAGVAVICFPIGLVWLSLQYVRPHLTNRSSQPLPGK